MKTVRPMREADLGEVLTIAADVPTAPHWPEFEFRRMLRVAREDPARRAAWVCLGARLDGQSALCGFALAARAADTAELEALVTAPAWRRQGVGLALVGAAAAWSRHSGAERLLLEARASNLPALRLYERLGFAVDGTRRSYYQNPEEDAILLSLRL